MAVGVPAEAFGEEAARRQDARIVLLVAQTRDRLRADALDRVVVEPRLGQSEAKQFEGFVGVLHEGLERSPDGVVAGIEGELDGARGEALLEGVGIVRTRALVEQPGEHLRDAGLRVRILGRAALEREGDRDERHDVGFDVPSLDALR